jgi:hypothetical protein
MLLKTSFKRIYSKAFWPSSQEGVVIQSPAAGGDRILTVSMLLSQPEADGAMSSSPSLESVNRAADFTAEDRSSLSLP